MPKRQMSTYIFELSVSLSLATLLCVVAVLVQTNERTQPEIRYLHITDTSGGCRLLQKIIGIQYEIKRETDMKIISGGKTRTDKRIFSSFKSLCTMPRECK